MKNEQLFTADNIIRSKDYGIKVNTPSKENKSNKPTSSGKPKDLHKTPHKKGIGVDERYITPIVSLEESGLVDDTDIESIYQGYDPDNSGYWN